MRCTAYATTSSLPVATHGRNPSDGATFNWTHPSGTRTVAHRAVDNSRGTPPDCPVLAPETTHRTSADRSSTEAAVMQAT